MHLNLALLAVVALGLVEKGESLRCWSCSSDMDAPCSDFFNTTKILRNQPYSLNTEVQLKECEPISPHYPYNTNQKVVCMKKKQTTYGRTSYVRQCRYLHADEQIGTCPTETTSSATTIDFCEYCDTEGCNGATSLQTTLLLSTIAPSAIFLLFRK